MADSLAEARSHNVPAEVFLRHWREIRDAKDVKNDSNMGHTRAKKAAKSAGINLDALKLVEQFAELELDEMEMLLKDVMAYCKWLKLPVGTQLEIFAAPAVTEPSEEAQQQHAEWEASQAGRAAGEGGSLREANTFEAGTAEHVAWDKAWAKGNKAWTRKQTEIAEEMGENAGGRRKRASAGNGHAASHP
jgi:hypothetical protein